MELVDFTRQWTNSIVLNVYCDIDKYCRENYHLNYGIEPHPNVKKINIENFDIICGGFPCQAFSNAGKKTHLTMTEVYYLTKL